MRRFSFKAFGALALSAALLNAGSVMAAQTSADTSAKVSDSELRTFAKVYTEYQDVTRQYEPALNNAKDPATSKKIQDEANAKLQKLLAKEHMSPEEYNRIFKLVNSDENLRKKVLAMVAEERKQTKTEKK